MVLKRFLFLIPFLLLVTVVAYVYIAYTFGIQSEEGSSLGKAITNVQFVVALFIAVIGNFYRAILWFAAFILCESWNKFSEHILRLLG